MTEIPTEVTRRLDSVAMVLYQPQDVVNVAAVIRVMSNFGLSDLRLVEPAAFDPYRILGIAHRTEAIVAAASRFATLEEALCDCTLVVATSGKHRSASLPVWTPREAAPLLLQATAAGRKVALLFGREQDGLPNEALDVCNAIITIPTHPQNSSLNLAQAALVLAYELWLAAAQPEGAGSPAAAGAGSIRPASALLEPAADLADSAARQQLFAALEGLLLALYPGTTPVRLDSAMRRLRHLLLRAAPSRAEAAALTNLLRHAARAAGPARR